MASHADGRPRQLAFEGRRVHCKEVQLEDIDRVREAALSIVENIKKVIIGKDSAVELAVVTLLCQGHALIEDVPGVGKTMLARSLARSTGCTFRRIQFTPDLLPSDITGVSIYNQQSGEFEFKAGPILSQLVLADEINRATPKTQSALLESMDEQQVTVEGVTHPLPAPFTVMATQNPIEYEGTFPLPEAQLDRFLATITLGYPSIEEELAIVNRQEQAHPIDTLSEVVSAEEIIEIQRSVRGVYVDDLIREYVVTLADRTRTHPDAALGSSPRGSLALFRGAQALALVRGRDFALPDDVKELAKPMLSHRIIVSPAGRMRGIQSADVVESVLDETPIPGGQPAGWFKR